MADESTVDKATTCPDCGAETVAGDRFCENCGNDLLLVAGGTPGDTTAPSPRGCAECGGTDIDADGFCTQCGFAQPAMRDRVELDLGCVAGVSDRGLRHHRNEDAMAVRATAGLDGGAEHVVAVVCDGVSTSECPDDASKAAADTAADLLLTAARAGDDLESATATAVSAAQAAVVELTGPGMRNAPACTYVSAVVAGEAVTVGWVGDSRAYWLASGDSCQLTVDDSWAQRMIEAGQLSEIDAMADPRSHALVAWLGADAGEVQPHVRTIRPKGPGVVLVCSDGLWNYLPDAEQLADAALPKAVDAPFTVAGELTAHAIDRGGHDNITVVVVPFPLSSSTKGTDS
ncbi:MAG TPA: PP2C family serine/threonine-protein phosphatase [Pseudonocardiaceae bacterium]|jgi:serine/threonine protein phosphatase PrpC|nr:PP2C family serine/threonine-protein phosphatase [Pseudonocardiaceae bacterium]